MTTVRGMVFLFVASGIRVYCESELAKGEYLSKFSVAGSDLSRRAESRLTVTNGSVIG